MDLSQSTVAVTGATGFIGSYIARAMLDRGADVRAVVRSPQKMRDRHARLSVHRADLSDVDALTESFEGCDAVVSNAGVVSLGRHSLEFLMDANARGTCNVFEAMRRAGVQRAVMTSSASAYARKQGVYVESDPLWTRDARVSRPVYYAVSKAVAEREAWRLAGEFDIDLSVARPSGVYGANDHTGFTKWFTWFMRVPVSIFPTHFYIPNVYAGDLADAMASMLERPVASGKAYNVVGDPDVSYWQMIAAYREAGGRVPKLVIPFPFPVRYAYSGERAATELDFKNRDPRDGFTDMLRLS